MTKSHFSPVFYDGPLPPQTPFRLQLITLMLLVVSMLFSGPAFAVEDPSPSKDLLTQYQNLVSHLKLQGYGVHPKASQPYHYWQGYQITPSDEINELSSTYYHLRNLSRKNIQRHLIEISLREFDSAERAKNHYTHYPSHEDWQGLNTLTTGTIEPYLEIGRTGGTTNDLNVYREVHKGRSFYQGTGLHHIYTHTKKPKEDVVNIQYHLLVLKDNLELKAHLQIKQDSDQGIVPEGKDLFSSLSVLVGLAESFLGVPADNPIEPDSTTQHLDVQCETTSLMADGQSQTTIHLGLYKADNRGLAGKPLICKLVPAKGFALGTLSATELTTGSGGQATLRFTAPKEEDVLSSGVSRAQITVTAEEFTLQETVYIDLTTKQPMQLSAHHAILPAHPDYTNELTFTFNTPDKAWGKDYEAILSCRSEFGRLRLGTSQTGSSELTITDAISGSKNTVFYQWTGPQPEAAVDEVVTIQIPDLKLQAEVPFSVGMDLVLETATLAWTGEFYPGMTLPIKAYLKDRFHPEADLGTLFKTFQIEPGLSMSQTSFTPVAVGSTLDDDFIQNFTHAVQGSTMPHGVQAYPILIGKLLQDGDRWLLTDSTRKGIASYLSVTCFDMGTYLFDVTLDPRFPGDAADQSHQATVTIDMQQIPPSQEMFFTFLVPTAQAYIALYPGGDKASALIKMTAQIYEGQYEDAVKTLGKELLLGNVVKNLKAWGAVQGQPYANEVMSELKKSLPAQSFARIEKALDHFHNLKSNQDVDKMIDILQMDILGNTLTTFGKNMIDFEVDHVSSGAALMQNLLKGNDQYGVLAVTRPGVSTLAVTDATGMALEASPGTLFGNAPQQRIYQGNDLTIIPFKKGEVFELQLEGSGDQPVQVYKILGDGTHAGVMKAQSQGWKKTLTIQGDTVLPQ